MSDSFQISFTDDACSQLFPSVFNYFYKINSHKLYCQKILLVFKDLCKHWQIILQKVQIYFPLSESTLIIIDFLCFNASLMVKCCFCF